MYGEPSRIREVAARLERRADQLRTEADELHEASQEVGWTSVAADRMREQARLRRDELRGVAREYDEAAQKVREHAAEVQRLLDLIASIERQVRSIISGALDRLQGALSDLAHGIKDALTPGEESDRRLANLDTPPPGHRDWLDMPDVVPGIRL
ncbi:hypothetical protein ACT8ZV_01685 [Nocardioides sp. MAHUQ-72]|uniref:hypothetical protein n=1 Tax=unclassified Nocardioides TaxID=2615069 RepID=UPI003620A981